MLSFQLKFLNIQSLRYNGLDSVFESVIKVGCLVHDDDLSQKTIIYPIVVLRFFLSLLSIGTNFATSQIVEPNRIHLCIHWVFNFFLDFLYEKFCCISGTQLLLKYENRSVRIFLLCQGHWFGTEVHFLEKSIVWTLIFQVNSP